MTTRAYEAGVLTIDGIEILLGFIVQLLGLLLKLLEATLGITVHLILGVFAEVELDLELLWRADDTLLEALKTHGGLARENIMEEDRNV